MSEDKGHILTGLYNYLVTDKVIHDGVFTKNNFIANDVITGSVSGATATVNYAGSKHFTYTLSTGLKLRVGDVITGSISGASCTIPKINELHTTVSDRIYFQEAIEDEMVDVLPYIVYSIDTSDTFLYYTGEYETISLSVMAFSEQSSSTQITAIDKQINDIFNKKSEIVMSNWSFKGLFKKRMRRLFRDSNKIWNLEINFDLVCQ